MNIRMLFLSWLVVVLSVTGCGLMRDSKETVTEEQPVIEPPPVVEHRETVIHEPVETRRIVVGSPEPRSYAYLTSQYASGSLYCRDGYEYQCVDGEWVSTGPSC
jgi:hypothetical protein